MQKSLKTMQKSMGIIKKSQETIYNPGDIQKSLGTIQDA